ncbi:MAG: hypothetical protein DME22_11840 [Verrucomicrobia bacterium]|nr:MAG: hypothetical protein DME22_11840 [Verrucomicrobiota bacterium]
MRSDEQKKSMNNLNLLAVGLGLWLLLPSVSAQVILGSTNIADRVGRIILPDRLLRDPSSGLTFGLRPPRPERPDLSLDIRQRVLSFEKLREVYLDRQQELLRKLRGGATDADRARIRAQLHGLRDQWLERARSFREEARARIRELQENELPKYRDAWDRTEGALDPNRKRRGE